MTSFDRDPSTNPRAGVPAADHRLRLMTTFGGGLVHELANRVGALAGLAEEVARQVGGGQAEPILRAAAGSRESLSLLRALVRLLEREPVATGPVRAHQVAAEAVAILQRHSAGTGGSIELAAAAADPRVGVETGELLQAIATSVLFARSSGDGSVRLCIGRRDAGRRLAAIEIADRGPGAPYAALRAALAIADGGCVPALRRVPGANDTLLLAIAMLRRHDGDLAVEVAAADQLAGPRALVLTLPEVAE